MVNIDEVDRISPELLISEICFNGRYNQEDKGLPKILIKTMRELDLKRIKDLIGYTEEDLMDIRRIGPTTAKIILRAIEKIDQNYPLNIFPWKVNIAIDVPERYIEIFTELGEEKASTLVTNCLDLSGLSRLGEEIRKDKIRIINDKIQSLKEELEELE